MKNKTIVLNGNVATLLNLLKIGTMIAAAFIVVSHFVNKTNNMAKQLDTIEQNQIVMQTGLTALATTMTNHLAWTDARNAQIDQTFESHLKRIERIEQTLSLKDALDRTEKYRN